MLLGSNEIIIIKNHPKTCCLGVFKKNDTFAIDKNIENELYCERDKIVQYE